VYLFFSYANTIDKLYSEYDVLIANINIDALYYIMLCNLNLTVRVLQRHKSIGVKNIFTVEYQYNIIIIFMYAHVL